jgi:hypothetical protein
MARTAAGFPEGTRVSDYITVGVVAEKIPATRVRQVLREVDRESRRIRKLPAHLVVYYVIALAIFRDVSYGEVLRCLVEGLEWLGQRSVRSLRQVDRGAISHARTRLGYEPMKRLYEELVGPIAEESTLGAWYFSPAGDGTRPNDRDRQRSDSAWRLVSIDGSTLDVPDEAENEAAFGRPPSARGQSGFPKLRFVALTECGTHVLFAAAEGAYRTSESELARSVLPKLTSGMLCLADRGFAGYDLWKEAAATGADLLWRFKTGVVLSALRPLPDGSYLSKLYASPADRRKDRGGILVRVIEYVLRDDLGNKRPIKQKHYRVVTTILDPEVAPAKDLAALYHERWEIENTFDEFKTHLRGRGSVLRSKKADLVRQEFYGFLLAHFVVRALMHEAALRVNVDPDKLSFVHSVRVIRRKIASYHQAQAINYSFDDGPFPPSGNRETS